MHLERRIQIFVKVKGLQLHRSVFCNFANSVMCMCICEIRNVLKATIDVPWAGEVNFHCTQLDHLDENWRMKQTNAIIQSSDCPHILAGGLNSLNGSDYSRERWMDIIKVNITRTFPDYFLDIHNKKQCYIRKFVSLNLDHIYGAVL